MSIIKNRREEMDLSRRQLANKLDVDMQLIVRWEKGQAPHLRYVPILYKVMGITCKQLVNDYKEEVK
jgi:ribosome-binding protein aMBF1 (putative translation factor)